MVDFSKLLKMYDKMFSSKTKDHNYNELKRHPERGEWSA